jgi:hypothetical protein
LSKHVESEEGVPRELVESETHNDKENCEDYETTELKGLAADCINKGDTGPVSGNGTCDNDDEIADGGVVKCSIHSISGGISNGGEDNWVV